jgi:WD40 repeat protein
MQASNYTEQDYQKHDFSQGPLYMQTPKRVKLVKRFNVGCPIFKVDWSSCGKFIYFVCADGRVMQMDCKSWVSKKVAEHPQIVDMVVFKSDVDKNDYILTIGTQKIVCIWNVDTCKVEFHTEVPYTPRAVDVSEGKEQQFAAIGCEGCRVYVLYLNTHRNERKMNMYQAKCNMESPIMSICIHKHAEATMRMSIGGVDGRICITDILHDSSF